MSFARLYDNVDILKTLKLVQFSLQDEEFEIIIKYRRLTKKYMIRRGWVGNLIITPPAHKWK